MVRKKGAQLASLVAVGVLAFGALAACGGDDNSGGGSGSGGLASTGTNSSTQIWIAVSLLIAELALPTGEADAAKAAVLLSSMAASLLGAAALIRRGRVHAATEPAGA